MPKNHAKQTDGLTIFLVDDSDANLLVGEARLSRMGHNIGVAKNGQQAVEGMQGNAYDVVLMDIQMPVLDGYEATREIRRTDQGVDVPIIGISAGGPGVRKEKAYEAGMNAFMPKPVDWDALDLLMRNLCRRDTGQNGQSD